MAQEISRGKNGARPRRRVRYPISFLAAAKKRPEQKKRGFFDLDANALERERERELETSRGLLPSSTSRGLIFLPNLTPQLSPLGPSKHKREERSREVPG